MTTVLEECPTEEQRSVVLYCGQRDSMKNIFIKKCFLFTGSADSLKDVRKLQMMSDQVRKWLRQQSKYFYVAGFNALVKRWGKCINVSGGYVEK
jgi:hypothetical protein